MKVPTNSVEATSVSVPSKNNALPSSADSG